MIFSNMAEVARWANGILRRSYGLGGRPYSITETGMGYPGIGEAPCDLSIKLRNHWVLYLKKRASEEARLEIESYN